MSGDYRTTHTWIILHLPNYGIWGWYKQEIGVWYSVWGIIRAVMTGVVPVRIYHHVAAWTPTLISPYSSTELVWRKCARGVGEMCKRACRWQLFLSCTAFAHFVFSTSAFRDGTKPDMLGNLLWIREGTSVHAGGVHNSAIWGMQMYYSRPIQSLL